MGVQPLAYLYLSQVPYTGLDLGPVGTVVYWVGLLLWSLVLAYLALFILAPYARGKVRGFGDRILAVLNSEPAPTITSKSKPSMTQASIPVPAASGKETARFSTYEGFKSFAREGALSIEDIVKGLSRTATDVPVAAPQQPVAPAPAPQSVPVVEVSAPRMVVEPIVPRRTQPAYEPRETGVAARSAAPVSEAMPHVRGFVAALLVRDRDTVFAMLRAHLRGGGQAEQLLTDAALALDEAYRSRMDGSPADADIVRVTAGYSTPMLEKVISILLTSIDSTYTDGSTSAKLILMRILALA